MTKQFGVVASASASFSRLIQSLCTRSGLKTVKACVVSSTPLHGKSDKDIGIKDACTMLRKYGIAVIYFSP